MGDIRGAFVRPEDSAHDDATTDEALIELTRDGDASAYGRLWQRHVDVARRAARAISPRLDTEDLVSEAFTGIFSAIHAGSGPRTAFRSYLFTAIRNTAATWGRRPVDLNLEHLEDVVEAIPEPQLDVDERDRLAAALAKLPERSRTLLWYLEVEGMKPREVAPLLGLSPNAVSALRRRAKVSLERAWLELAA
jgi:RNA polymerase sigma factor (sigma-70 family)